MRSNQPITPEITYDLEYLLETYPDKRQEFFEQYIATNQSTRLVKNVYCLRRVANLYPEKKDELFKIYILNKLNGYLVKNIYSLTTIKTIFPNKIEAIFDTFIASNAFDDELVNTLSQLEEVAQIFPDQKERLFTKYIESNQFDDQLVQSIYDLKRIVQIFPDKKERLFAKYVESNQLDDRLVDSTYELTQLVELYPEKKDKLFSKYIALKKFNAKIFQQDCLPTLLNLFSEERQQHMIINNYLNYHYPNSKRLSPHLYVTTQKGPTCGFNALSAITKYFSIKEKNSLLFFSVKKADSINGNTGLRKIGKIVGIDTCGGIYSLKLFRDLIAKINLHGEVLHVREEKDFSDIICGLIDHNIPIILPFDWDKIGGNAAHYAVVMGYTFDENGKLNLIITHYGRYELHTSEFLFSLNSDLHKFNKNLGLYIKKIKQDVYVSTPPDQANQNYHKKYQYKPMNLQNTLKNRLLMVVTKDMFNEIQKDAAFFQKIKPFIEQNPQGIELLESEDQPEQNIKFNC